MHAWTSSHNTLLSLINFSTNIFFLIISIIFVLSYTKSCLSYGVLVYNSLYLLKRKRKLYIKRYLKTQTDYHKLRVLRLLLSHRIILNRTIPTRQLAS